MIHKYFKTELNEKLYDQFWDFTQRGILEA